MKRGDDHPQFDFDAVASIAARDEAIQRVDANADPAWKAAAELAIHQLAKLLTPFTTDDVWRKLAQLNVELPHEHRALGAIMTKMRKHNVIRMLEDYKHSVMVSCHRRPKQLWIGCI